MPSFKNPLSGNIIASTNASTNAGTRRRICWAEAQKHSVQCASSSGTRRSTVIDGGRGGIISWPNALALRNFDAAPTGASAGSLYPYSLLVGSCLGSTYEVSFDGRATLYQDGRRPEGANLLAVAKAATLAGRESVDAVVMTAAAC